MNDKVAWIHPNPLLAGFVVLPDGYQLTRDEAKAKGFTLSPWPDQSKIATVHPHDKDSVVLPRGTVVNRDTAKAAGFEVSEKPHLAARSAQGSWRAGIFALPEGRDRPSAVAEIVTSQNPGTMTVAAAKAFLRGLPIEQEEETSLPIDNQDPRAARLAEISDSMRLVNKERGFAAKPKAPQSIASIEPARLKRMAEIRLAALGARSPNSAEQKNLAYALQVHDQTGAPLVNIFAQLGVDTSKLVPNNV